MSSLATSGNMTVKTMDLTARGLDLLTALTNAASSQSGPVHMALEIGKWLRLEGVNEYELQDCWAMAKDLIIPNELGEQFHKQVRNAKNHKFIPFFLQQAGSLGRFMTRDYHLSWMISTTACLFQFHDERFVSDALSMLIMQSQLAKDDKPAKAWHAKYHPASVQLRTVLDKISNSVWLNIVNSGHATTPLPPELNNVCRRGHNLDADSFGIVAHTLRTTKDLVIVESPHLLKNLTLWLTYHFHGRLQVTVGGELLYDRQLGISQQIIQLKVKRSCPKDGPCPEEEISAFRLHHNVADKFQEFLSGTYPEQGDIPQNPRVRQALYDTHLAYTGHKTLLSTSSQIRVRCTAQIMMRWLLSLPVKPLTEKANFTFDVNPNAEATSKDLQVKDLLSRIPTMLNRKWGSIRFKGLVFSEPVADSNPDSPERKDMNMFDIQEDIHGPRLNVSEMAFQNADEILPYYPIIKDLLDTVGSECECPDCGQKHESTEERKSKADHEPVFAKIQKEGCLRSFACKELLTLLAHGIAEGFGADDVSAMKSLAALTEGMMVVLLELAKGREAVWDTWFALAASVVLGCPFKRTAMEPGAALEFDGSTFAAFQYGNLAAIAPWLDLTCNINVKGIFSMAVLEGKLGVSTGSENDLRFRGISEKFATVQTEHTESLYKEKEENTASISNITSMNGAGIDDSSAEIDVILTSADAATYRLFTRIKTGRFWRVVDPSDAVKKVSKDFSPLSGGVNVVSCEHLDPESVYAGERDINDILEIHNFEKVVSDWDDSGDIVDDKPDRMDEDSPESEASGSENSSTSDQPRANIHYYMTKRLDTYLKFNLALALTSHDMAVVNSGNCCLACTLCRARDMSNPDVFWGTPERQASVRRIIYAQTMAFPLSAQDDRRIGNKRKAKEIMEI